MANPVTEFGYKHKHLADSAAVIQKQGILHSVTINRPDNTAGAIITLYDSVDDSGVVIAIITMDKAIFVVPVTLIYDVELAYGLYAKFSHTDGSDITISYN